MKSELEKSLKKKWAIRLITKHPENDGYNGVVLHYSRSIIAIKEYNDFKPDGLIFFPRKAIGKIRDGKFEKCENKILRMTGDIKASKKLRWISGINNLKDLFTHCYQRKVWPAVETVQSGEDYLYVGPITKVTSSSIWLYCYDGEGEWEDEYNIKYRDVIRVEIMSHYVDTFNKYMTNYNMFVQGTAQTRRRP